MSKSIRLVLRSFSISPSTNQFVYRTIRRTFVTTCNAEDMTAEIVATSQPTTTSTTWSPKMIAWQAHSYGTIDDLVLTNNARSPAMVGPKDVLVHIKASSVNPLDVLMTGNLTNKYIGILSISLGGSNVLYNFQKVSVMCYWAPYVKRSNCPCTNP